MSARIVPQASRLGLGLGEKIEFQSTEFKSNTDEYD